MGDDTQEKDDELFSDEALEDSLDFEADVEDLPL